MYDLVAIGDATMDVFVQIDDANVMCDIHKEHCKLCLNYADKIAAKQVDFIIGGNALNAAVGARRLGLSSAFLSSIGHDETGHQIKKVMEKEGVSSEYLMVVKDQPSNYSVVINFQGERTILVHHVPRDYVWNVKMAPKWFYVTSTGEGFEKLYDEVVKMVHQTHTFVAFNPGTHQLKKGLAALKPMLAVTTILFLNKEESAELLGLKEIPTVKKLLEGLQKLGPEKVVITDGKDGSYAFDGVDMYQLGIYDGPIVERTGAGDSFATAFTVAIHEGKSVPEAMEWGNANSTSVVGKVGPEAGLLDQRGLEALIAKNKNIKPISL